MPERKNIEIDRRVCADEEHLPTQIVATRELSAILRFNKSKMELILLNGKCDCNYRLNVVLIF